MTKQVNYKPLNDMVLILADKKLEATKNGIVLPESLKTGTKTGVVVAVGPGKFHEKTGKLMPMSVVVGQRVTFGEFAGRSDLPVDPEYPRGAHYKVVPNGDILGVVEPADDDFVARMMEAFRILGIEKKATKILNLIPDSTASFIVGQALGELVCEHLTNELRYLTGVTSGSVKVTPDKEITQSQPFHCFVKSAGRQQLELEFVVPALMHIGPDGDAFGSVAQLNILARRPGEKNFILVDSLEFKGKSTSPTHKFMRLELTEPGEWEIRCERYTADAADPESLKNRTKLASYFLLPQEEGIHPTLVG